jgi:hypothetical protein
MIIRKNSDRCVTHNVPSSLFVKSIVLNPESNILVWCSCTSTTMHYSLQPCTQLYGRTTSTTKFSTSVGYLRQNAHKFVLLKISVLKMYILQYILVYVVAAQHTPS